MVKPTITKLSSFVVKNKNGELYSIEDKLLGCDIKRAFYITNFSDNISLNNRGNHSHKDSKQFLINIRGIVDIKIINIDSLDEVNFTLDSPDKCLFLPPRHHIFMNNYSTDSIMLVLCDKNYEEDDVTDYYVPENLDGFREVSKFLGVTTKSIIDKYNHIYLKTDGLMKFKALSDLEFKIFFDNNQPDREKLVDFYSNTNNLLLELVEYHSTNFRRNLTQYVVNFSNNNQLSKVLDFGCGIGEDGFSLLKEKKEVYFCDISSRTFEFIKWRVDKKSYKSSFIALTVDNEYSFFKKKKFFDLILCFEVLMHIDNPLKTIKYLYNLLNQNGFLFVTYRFNGNYSLALRKNMKLEQSIENDMIDIGFSLYEKVLIWPNKFLFIYKK